MRISELAAKIQHAGVSLLNLCDSSTRSSDEAKNLEQALERLKSPRHEVGVVGLQGHGKSTLINALLGESLAYSGPEIAQNCVTRIQWGEPRCEVLTRTDDGELQREVHPITGFRELGRRGGVSVKPGSEIVAFTQSAFLLDGVCLVDTPGADAGLEAETDNATVEDYLRNANVVLVAVLSRKPGLAGVFELLEQAGRSASDVVVALTMSDLLEDEDEVEEAISVSRRQMRVHFGSDVPVFAVSARGALNGASDGADAALEMNRLKMRLRRSALSARLGTISSALSALDGTTARLRTDCAEALRSLETVEAEMNERVSEADALLAKQGRVLRDLRLAVDEMADVALDDAQASAIEQLNIIEWELSQSSATQQLGQRASMRSGDRFRCSSCGYELVIPEGDPSRFVWCDHCGTKNDRNRADKAINTISLPTQTSYSVALRESITLTFSRIAEQLHDFAEDIDHELVRHGVVPKSPVLPDSTSVEAKVIDEISVCSNGSLSSFRTLSAAVSNAIAEWADNYVHTVVKACTLSINECEQQSARHIASLREQLRAAEEQARKSGSKSDCIEKFLGEMNTQLMPVRSLLQLLRALEPVSCSDVIEIAHEMGAEHLDGCAGLVADIKSIQRYCPDASDEVRSFWSHVHAARHLLHDEEFSEACAQAEMAVELATGVQSDWREVPVRLYALATRSASGPDAALTYLQNQCEQDSLLDERVALGLLAGRVESARRVISKCDRAILDSTVRSLAEYVCFACEADCPPGMDTGIGLLHRSSQALCVESDTDRMVDALQFDSSLERHVVARLVRWTRLEEEELLLLEQAYGAFGALEHLLPASAASELESWLNSTPEAGFCSPSVGSSA